MYMHAQPSNFLMICACNIKKVAWEEVGPGDKGSNAHILHN